MTARLKRCAIVLALSAAQADAQNSIYFVQTDTLGGTSVGIDLLTINQTGAYNDIGRSGVSSFVKGALGELTIRQAGDENSVNLSLFTSDSSALGGFKADLEGHQNTFDFALGSSTTRQLDPAVAMRIRGYTNVSANTLSASDADRQLYRGIITGNYNDATVTATGTFVFRELVYSLEGDENYLIVGLTGVERATVDASINGNTNDWELQTAVGDSEIIVSSFGSQVDGTIRQESALAAAMNLQMTKMGTEMLYFTASSSADYAVAMIDLVALGGGSFSLNQGSAGARYDARHVIAAGGTAVINQ